MKDEFLNANSIKVVWFILYFFYIFHLPFYQPSPDLMEVKITPVVGKALVFMFVLN